MLVFFQTWDFFLVQNIHLRDQFFILCQAFLQCDPAAATHLVRLHLINWRQLSIATKPDVSDILDFHSSPANISNGKGIVENYSRKLLGVQTGFPQFVQEMAKIWICIFLLQLCVFSMLLSLFTDIIRKMFHYFIFKPKTLNIQITRAWNQTDNFLIQSHIYWDLPIHIYMCGTWS